MASGRVNEDGAALRIHEESLALATPYPKRVGPLIRFNPNPTPSKLCHSTDQKDGGSQAPLHARREPPCVLTDCHRGEPEGRADLGHKPGSDCAGVWKLSGSPKDPSDTIVRTSSHLEEPPRSRGVCAFARDGGQGIEQVQKVFARDKGLGQETMSSGLSRLNGPVPVRKARK